jgi:hypothetical protein
MKQDMLEEQLREKAMAAEVVAELDQQELTALTQEIQLQVAQQNQ